MQVGRWSFGKGPVRAATIQRLLEEQPVSTVSSRYDHLTKEQLIALLEKQRREKKLGLVWERDALEPDQDINSDFVALTLDPELSTGFAPYQNLLIEGDNYDVLRYLHIAYRGRVKVIYIDPPYNTGSKDFIYNDRFVDEEHRYRHSLWLEFMARRLELARDLLAEDGVIFVSISEHEQARLVMLMDEIFPGMRIGSFVWRTRSGANDEKNWFLSVDHEWVVAYGNPGFMFGGSEKSFDGYRNPDNDPRGDWASDNLVQGKTMKQRPDTFYTVHNPDNDVWYPCDPSAVWRFATKDRAEGKTLRSMTMEELIEDNRIDWKDEPTPAFYGTEQELMEAIRDGLAPANLSVYLELDTLRQQVERGEAPARLLDHIPPVEFWVGKKIGYMKPRLKRFRSELKRATKPLSTWIQPAATVKSKEDREALAELEADAVTLLTAGYNTEGTKALRRVLGTNDFSYPKPLSLLKELIAQSTSPQEGHIVLDFFAGSGTTGQAVLELNQEDDGDRRFILVSSTESTAEQPDKNVCRDVASKRLRNVINGYEVPTKGGRKSIEGAGGELGYLITKRIPFENLHTELEEAQTWLALQHMHDLGLSPYEEGQCVQAIDDGAQRVLYVPSVTQEALLELQRILSADALATRVYSPTPGLIETRVFSEHATFAAVPDSIIERFLP